MTPTPPNREFFAGVIEGFYGPPWTRSERLELFDWMAAFRLNTYVYAPKDDLAHRALWRQPYSPAEAEAIGELILACAEHGLRFVYALSPGLDLDFSQPTELAALQKRFEQLLALGCRDFALLFDDIPERMSAEDQARWGSFAAAQCHVTNEMFHWTRRRRPEAHFLFCPTAYCGRMVRGNLGGPDYLDTVGRELSPEIDVFWTGPEIIARAIPAPSLRELRKTLRRKPLIWDNLFANDYDGRRCYCGPYAGRAPELRAEVAGLLINPNTEFPLNFVPLRTFSQFIQGGASWDARQAYLSAMAEWLPRFQTARSEINLEDLVLLGDCYYLPHEEGPTAEALYTAACGLLTSPPAAWSEQIAGVRQPATRLRDCCARLAELRDRALYHALSRRIWELREELDLLLGYLSLQEANPGAPCRSDFHLPGTFRGGMVARWQRLLAQHPDGTFSPQIGIDAKPAPPVCISAT